MFFIIFYYIFNLLSPPPSQLPPLATTRHTSAIAMATTSRRITPYQTCWSKPQTMPYTHSNMYKTQIQGNLKSNPPHPFKSPIHRNQIHLKSKSKTSTCKEHQILITIAVNHCGCGCWLQLSLNQSKANRRSKIEWKWVRSERLCGEEWRKSRW